MSASPAYHAFVEHIAYEGQLRLRVQRLPEDDADTVHRQSLNTSVLACIASLEDHQDVKTPDEDTSAAARQLARLEARLDVLTELVTRALAPDAHLPQPVAARLNALGLASAAVPSLECGTRVRAQVHFDACRALPLQLDGRVETAPDGVFVAFDALHGAARETLERLVFRHHRRRVARARQASDQDAT